MTESTGPCATGTHRGLSIEVRSTVVPTVWNEGIRRARGGSIFQTTYWADYWRRYFDATPHYFVVRDGSTTVGQLLTLEMPVVAESLLAGRRRTVRRIVAPLLRALSWREGPVMLTSDFRDDIVNACLEAVCRHARARRTLGVHTSYPPLTDSDAESARLFARFGFSVAREAATVRIDLRQPLDALWARLKHGVARTPIRKAQRQGVAFVEVRTAEQLKRYYTLVRRWRALNGLAPYSFAKFSLMMAHLPQQATMFLADVDGEAIAGAGLWHYCGRAYFFTPAQSEYARAHRIYAGDFLIWEMIRWCHQRGYEMLDLSGVSTGTFSTKEAGIRRFKEKWGGDVLEYQDFTMRLRSWQWTFVDRVRDGWHTALSLASKGSPRSTPLQIGTTDAR